ncbi:MAG: right-handed parallel beta-helix repeat-containing protein [Planctomycetota bacterium]
MATTLRTSFVLLLVAALAGCGGHLGDLNGPNVRPNPPILPPSATPSTGLTALCAGDGILRADYVLPGAGFEAALFLGPDRLSTFASAPVAAPLTGTNRVVTNAEQPTLVVNGTTVFAGMGIRAVGATAWTPVGAPIRCRPSAPIYVDSLGPANGDGSSPALAYPKLDNALLVAAVFSSLFGGANVWVLDGTYTTRPFDAGTQEGGAFAVGPGVHVYGGFQTGFDLADRNADGGGTILHGSGTSRIVDVISGGDMHVLDGFVVDGENVMVEGIDVTESDCEIRSTSSRRCVDNGLRIRQLTNFVNRRDVLLVACDVTLNGNDGVGVSGAFDLFFERSTFDANGGRGIDPNDLLALSGNSASLRAFGCRFFGNSLDGLGADLNTIATSPQTPGGSFRVEVEGCTFERNGRDGLFIDQDYDTFPEWYTTVRVRDCSAIANRRAGVHFDADDQGDYVLDRIRCTANGGDGLWVSSEPNNAATTLDDLRPGHVLVTSSSFLGNLGFGVHATEGDKVVLASHCAFSGNQLGGFESLTTGPRGDNPRRIGSAVNCVVWRQPNPFANVRTASCFVETLDNPFENAPSSYSVAVSNVNGSITLAAGSGIVDGSAIEIGDSGAKLTVTDSVGGAIVVTPAPATFVAPDSVFDYPNAATASMVEDLRLYSGTAALGTALVAAGDPPRNPGPHGSLAGGEPGVYDPFTPLGLRLLHTEPAIATGVTANQPMVLVFSEAVDASTVTADRIRLRTVADFQLSVSGNRVTVNPPVAGWPAVDSLEVHMGLRAVSGALFGAPHLVPVLTR